MKIIVIGRGEDADVRIEDSLISRRHATIKMLPMGKMEIRDLSKNGTFVNGIRLAVNKPVRITRKDVVSFARVSQLDWKEIPDPMKPYRIVAVVVAALIVGLLLFSLVSRLIDVYGSKGAGKEEIEISAGDANDAAREKEAQEKVEKQAKPKVVPDKEIPNFFPEKNDKNKNKDKNKKEEAEERKSDKNGNEAPEATETKDDKQHEATNRILM
ncbi:MAG: FHA domain-containing protein [Muribaculaceae bacterium]|nr:FHA domain-containing protein [Muribaculaceae bacterium]